jgi:TM2 domain-containing membrane protein YozV
MSGASFGRKGAGADVGLAARRAAFLAEERARPHQPPPGEEIAAATRPIFVREKSLNTAYLLWFFFGGVSAHRFYLGSPASGAIQLALTPLGYGLLISKSQVGYAVLLCAWLWILADLFIIPSLTRAANERFRPGEVASVFA